MISQTKWLCSKYSRWRIGVAKIFIREVVTFLSVTKNVSEAQSPTNHSPSCHRGATIYR